MYGGSDLRPNTFASNFYPICVQLHPRGCFMLCLLQIADQQEALINKHYFLWMNIIKPKTPALQVL